MSSRGSALVGVIFLGLFAMQAAMAADYHYRGRVNIDPHDGLLDAEWEISLLSEVEGPITFLLRNTIDEVTVTGDRLVSATVGSEQGFENFTSVVMELATYEPGQSVRMNYSAVLIPEPMDNRINAIEPGYIELNVDSFWFPIDSRFSKLLTAEVDLMVGEGWQGVSTGDVTPIQGGMHVVNKDPRLDIALALSKSFRITRLAGFTLYDQRESPAGTDALVTTATRCRQYLDERFGQSNPLPVGRFLITTRSESGYARENYIVFTDIADTSPAPLTRFVCHEFAHYWARGGKFDTVENWINESFAEYLGMMAVRAFHGEETYGEMLVSMRKQIEGKELPPIWVPGATERGPYLVNYRKGPLALAWLENQVGEKYFLAFVQKLFALDEKTTPLLLDTLEMVAGQEARGAFAEKLSE